MDAAITRLRRQIGEPIKAVSFAHVLDGEHVRLRDWLPVLGRAAVTGLALSTVRAAIALVRIIAWEFALAAAQHAPLHGAHYAPVVALGVAGVVTKRRRLHTAVSAPRPGI